MGSRSAERIVLIGVGGVDWSSLRAVMRRGLAPNISALVARGGLGSLQHSGPRAGVAPWATMATGHEPLVHGVFRESEAWAGGVRPTTRASWQRPPVWATLAEAGVATASAGWPASAPGDSWAGQHVDESYAVASAPAWNDWALPLHCASPPLREALRDLRIHPTDIGAAQLLPLVPDLGTIDQARDSGLPALAVGMARTATIQAAALHLLGEPTWQAMFVHHRWMGEIRRADTSSPPWDRVVDGAWRFFDGLIGQIAAMAGEDCTVIVASPGAQRSTGIVIAAGPGVRPASEIVNARLIDLAPTVLGKFDLHDSTSPGRVIAGAGVTAGTRAAPAIVPAETAGDVELAQMMALGYAPPPAPPTGWQVEGLLTRSVLLLAVDPAAAGKAADDAIRLMPDLVEAIRMRARAHVLLNEAEPLPALGDALLGLAPHRPWGSLIHGAAHAMRQDAAKARPWLEAAAASGDPETVLHVGAAWLMLSHAAEARLAFAAVLAGDPANAEAAVGLSVAALSGNDLQGAEKPLRQVLARDPHAVPAWLQLADVLQRGGRTHEATVARKNAARFGGPAADL
ncbi:MAG: alkaline phosphatase family protein [Janthinobacterium lividum]